MRVPEDYIMGTGKKSKSLGCSFFIFLLVIGAIILICSVNVSASSTPIERWLSKEWEEIKRIFIVMISIAGVAILGLLFYTAFTSSKGTHKKTDIQSLTPLEYEQFIGQYLREKGYKHVQTTKASGDFGADILCEDREGRAICIQCKHYSKPVGIKAVQEVISAKEYYKCDEAWVCASNAYTPAAHEMATRTGVKLYTIK